VHIIPAAGAGVVLNVVGRISGRLIGAVLGFLVLLALAVFAGRLIANVIAPHLYAAYARAIAGLTRMRSPVVRRVGVWLDPEKANLRAHIIWGVVLLACAVGIAGIIRQLANGNPLVRADTAIAQLAQSLRTQFIDRIAVVVTTFGSGPVIAAAVVVLLIVLLVSNARRTAALVATVFVATVAFVPLIRFAFSGRRPLDLYPSFEAFTFPSSQATFTVLFCGVIAILASPSLGATSRVAVWTAGILVAATVGLARIYLNLHWASDVFAGFLIGTAVTAIFALIVRDYEKETLRSLQIPVIAMLGFLVVGTVDASVNFHTDLRRYAPRPNTRVMELSEWQASGWRTLPQRRADVLGETEEKILVQLSADQAALAEALAPSGWQKAAPFKPVDLLLFLSPNAALEAFPPLPLMHLGRVPDLAFVQPSGDPDHRTVIRLWRSDLALREAGGLRPVLVGTVTDERVSHPYEALTIISDRPASESALARVRTLFERLPDPPFAVDLRDGTRGPLLLISGP
jgi:undecaprenyl-diphosphatase